MLRFSDIVFGPILSRRLGSSLGINLLPRDGKMCNFDCIYCECGWNKDGREGSRILPTATDVEAALRDKLASCKTSGTAVDSITFSGNGEPTINPEFPKIIDLTISLRDEWFPNAKVSVLSNATTLDRKEIRDALKKVDNPILKIDGGSDAIVSQINHPAASYSLEKVIEGMLDFNGDFVLQTMFLRGEGFDLASEDNLKSWMDMVRRLRPREIMVYTLDRQAPQAGLSKYTVEEMRTMVAALTEEGFTVQISG